MTDVLIGVAGYAGSGKDTLVDLMTELYGVAKISFADPMRAMTAAIDPVVGYVEGSDGELEIIRYNDAIEFVGYTQAKVDYPEIRRFLQRLGTEGGRETFGENVWSDLAIARAQSFKRVAFADMRFRNEAQAVKASGGVTFRVTRPGVEAPNDHASEHDLDGWTYDAHIQNNGTIEDLKVKLAAAMTKTLPKILPIS